MIFSICYFVSSKRNKWSALSLKVSVCPQPVHVVGTCLEQSGEVDTEQLLVGVTEILISKNNSHIHFLTIP